MTGCCAFCFALPVPLAESAQASRGGYPAVVREHLETLLEHGRDRVGPRHTELWVSALNTRTLEQPRGHVPVRPYRQIGAPDGSTLYWDLPSLLAARELSRLTGDPRYADAARAYVRDFLECCARPGELFDWGNHRFYDVFGDTVVRFSGGHHELRPHTPAWELFWEVDPVRTELYLREMVGSHLYDPAAGGFNRHSGRQPGLPFTEAGGVLVESLGWLYSRTGDPGLLDLALRVARHSFAHRDPATGLIANAPGSGRWDGEVSTTEIGVWAQALLRTAELTGAEELRDMAHDAVLPYLRFGYDAGRERYFGQLRLSDGSAEIPRETGYWPREHADAWNVDQWPTHDYPMALADAALTLYLETGQAELREAVERFARSLQDSPEGLGIAPYAGSYGAAIHFLARAGRELDDPAMTHRARELADEAVQRLRENGLLQGRPGTHLYESVDGVGVLLLALLELETGDPVPHASFVF